MLISDYFAKRGDKEYDFIEDFWRREYRVLLIRLGWCMSSILIRKHTTPTSCKPFGSITRKRSALSTRPSFKNRRGSRKRSVKDGWRSVRTITMD